MTRSSLITAGRFVKYVEEAEQLYEVVSKACRERGFHIFSAALMGAQLVVAATRVMKGDLKWWFKFMEAPEGIEAFIVQTSGLQNFPGGGGET